ncbi:MAG TPA: prenyltransferase/squalene oxidase repeat-containing protein [Syntrophorhabdaceae bacterium]|nr:prenyltransferase/squalene oxidase repeat-containing protein [Syntrophorhabdaceae bacterium]
MKNTVAERIAEKSIDHIMSVEDDSGGWSRLRGEFPIETEPTSWAVTVFCLRKLFSDGMTRGVEFIIRDQLPDGSWGNNAAHTGFAVIALKAAGADRDAVDMAISYLKSVQTEEGGFQRIAGVGEPSSLHTSIVLFALQGMACDNNEDMVKRSLEWLTRCQNQDGGYGVSVGEPSVAFATARCIKAFRIHDIPITDLRIQKAIAWLLQVQKASGGFSMTASHPEDPELTAYAITALNGLEMYREQIEKAVDYLGNVQEADGAFVSYAPIQFDGVAKKNTQTTCFVAWALLEMTGRGAESVARSA